MEFIISLSKMWLELYNGTIGKFLYYSTFTPPRLVLILYGYEEVPSGDDLTLLDKVVKEAYEILVDLFSKVIIFPGDPPMTLADVSLFSLMFGLGVLAIIVFTIIKWADLVKPLKPL